MAQTRIRALSHKALERKWNKVGEDFPKDLGLQVHRALSWLQRAEEEMPKDPGAAFIFYWISFNAIYANDLRHQTPPPSGKDQVREVRQYAKRNILSYFGKIVDLDKSQSIYNLIWERFPGPIRALLENQYTFQPFWDHYNGFTPHIDWEKQLALANRKANQCFRTNDIQALLSILFDRLYVLRNQMVHGGATWNGRVNRSQVQSGASILKYLVPLFIGLMMDNPTQKWGRPFYPPVEQT